MKIIFQTVSSLQMSGGSPEVKRKTGEGNDVTELQVCDGEKLKLGSEVRQKTETQDVITCPAGEWDRVSRQQYTLHILGESGDRPTKLDISGAQSFVRVYTDRNGNPSQPNSSYRKSMAIRPQTVANLASKFDSIVHDKAPLKKSNSRQLKLRTFDITKIINELNKINDEADKTEKLNPPEKVSKSDCSEENVEEPGSRRTVRSGQTVHSAEACADQLLHSDTSDRSVRTPEPAPHPNTNHQKESALGKLIAASCSSHCNCIFFSDTKKAAQLAGGSEGMLRSSSSRIRDESLVSIMSVRNSAAQCIASWIVSVLNTSPVDYLGSQWVPKFPSF